MTKLQTLRGVLCFGSARDLTNDPDSGPELEDDLIQTFTP